MTGPAPLTPGEAPGGPVRYRLDAGIAVDRGEMLRYLGYAGQKIDGELAGRIGRIAAEVEGSLVPRGVSRAFPIDTDRLGTEGSPGVRLAGAAVELDGGDIARHLAGARAAVLMAVTLGAESERRLRTLASLHPLDAALYDAACSAYIEAAADEVDRRIALAAERAQLTRNGRFSCGYGDFPLTAQAAIVGALDAGRAIGLTVTAESLLIPTKSVTAVIGIFDEGASVADASRTCAGCALRDGCAFRRRGETCYHPRHS